MNQVLVDTNAYSALMLNNSDVQEILNFSRVFIPLIAIGELRGGFKYGSKEQENEGYLQTFLRKSTVLIPDLETTLEYASIYAKLRANGRAVPQNDIWIAALCFQYQLPIVTFDKHFQMIEGLQVITKLSDLLE